MWFYKNLNFFSPRLNQTFYSIFAEALNLVSMAATHANDAMKRIEKFKKLLEVQESLGGTVDLVSPTRELLKEGKIVKISARSGDHQDRYLFLVSIIWRTLRLNHDALLRMYVSVFFINFGHFTLGNIAKMGK